MVHCHVLHDYLIAVPSKIGTDKHVLGNIYKELYFTARNYHE